MLTCQPCDNTAGSLIDASARRRENIRDVMEQRPGPKRWVRIELGDTFVNAQVFTDPTDGRTTFYVPPSKNRPGAIDALAEIVRLNQHPVRVVFQQDHFSPVGARVSWLKSAYLTLFALFGYAVVGADELDIVRSQIWTSNCGSSL